LKLIKSILNNIGKEFKYLVYSYALLLIFTAVLALSVWNLYLQMKQAENNYQVYLHSRAEYEKQGMDIEKALHAPSDVQKQENGNGSEIEFVDNVLKYDYDNVSKALTIMRPNRILTQTLEWLTFFFFPLIFAIYGLYVATYDYKYKTYRVKAVQTAWYHLLIAKQLTVYLSALAVVVVTLALSYPVGLFFYRRISGKIPIHDFHLNVPMEHHVLWQFLLSLFICFLFSTLGFCAGVVFQRFSAPAILFVVYHFLIPFLGKYDLRNMVAVLGHKVFSFYGNFQLVKPVAVPVPLAIVLPIVFVIVCTLAAYGIAMKQSKYVKGHF
jgi:hypothetical protein